MPHPYMDGRPLLASEVTFYTLLNAKFGALQYRLGGHVLRSHSTVKSVW